MILDRKERLKLYSNSVKKLLSDIGQKLGFEVKTEWDTGVGFIDLVWCKKLDYPLMNDKHTLPIVGFEIESSWRTYKHLKGDVFNLLSLSPSLGVIVLIERGFRKFSKRRGTMGQSEFQGNLDAVKKYINTFQGISRIEVWTASDIENLHHRIFGGSEKYFSQEGILD